ncbi:MAG: peptide ABC transporter substrate-binding protein, partial [Ruminococcus sp.]|nr:peptide ABC transporter substrate-binding protein [Ruminococcus sp.]
SSNTIIKNLYSGLLSTDQSGNINCCNAKSYDVSSNGLEYTFHLRDDNYWFYDKNKDDIIEPEEYFPVTAADYAFALKRVLDPAMQSPFAEQFTCIKHGGLVNHGELALEMLGVSAEDEHTLKITLEYPCAEFPELMTTAAAYPCNEEFFYSTKGRYGLDDESVMSNGAFFVRQWFYDPYGHNNILYMKANSANETESREISPSFLSFEIEDSEDEIRQMFKDGETQCFTSMFSTGYNPEKYPTSESSATTLGLIFNPDDKIYSDLNLRKALSLSIDREALGKQFGSDMQPAYGIIPPAVDLLGRSYRELSSEEIFDVYDPKEARNYLEKARTELGTRSFEGVKILVNSAVCGSGPLHQLSQGWQDTLGIYIGIEDVTDEEFYSRIDSGDYSIALYPVRGHSCSGLAVISQFEKLAPLNYALGDYRYSTDILRCPTPSELVEAYSSAERGILGQFGFIPVAYKKSYLITAPLNEEIYFDPFTGAVDYRQAKNYH